MNNGRALTFILLTSAIMLTAIFFQSRFNPPKPVEDGVQVTENTPADSKAAEENAGNETSEQAGASLLSNETDGQALSADVDSDESDDLNSSDSATEPDRLAVDEFVTIGSLASDGSDRYLVTINKRGGTVRRVELNFRIQKSGRYKYRDLVWNGGYLGCLECLATDEGCLVRVVGPGTPAQIAGIQVDDIIESVNGELITTAIDFETYISEKTKPGTDAEIVIKRGGQSQTFTVSLTDKPIEVLRPEPGLVDPNFDYPESFVTSLIKPMQELEKAWPDLDTGMRDVNWTVVGSTIDSGENKRNFDNEVELKFELLPSQLAAVGFEGPVTTYKRFSLPELTPETIYSLDSHTFHLGFDFAIENGTDQPQEFAYELDGPTGVTAEAWWFENKIHGRQTAIGYMAGARDVVGSTANNDYIFWGCSEIIKGAESNPVQPKYISSQFKDAKDRELNYVAVDSHYFNVALIPNVPEGDVFRCENTSAFPNIRNGQIAEIPKNARLKKLVDVTFQMVVAAEIAPNERYSQSFDIFCGPKETVLLEQYGLSDVRTFGWFSWCSKVLLAIMHFFYYITFKTSYGLAIIMMTVLVRCCMIPVSRKAALNAQMMQHLQPQMKEIADKYKDNMEKRSAAQRDLYKKYNFNPFGGCFMMFFQLPVFYGLYKGLNVDIALRDQPLIPGLSWCGNLAAPDQLMYWKDWMPGVLANETGWLGPFLNILPLITMVLFIAQQKLFTPPPTDDQQKMMQKMMTFMMLFMGIMFFKVPAGLCIYFITSSLWGIIERKLLPKPVLNTDKLAVAGGGGGSINTRQAKKIAMAEVADNEKRDAETESRKQRNADRKRKLKKRDK